MHPKLSVHPRSAVLIPRRMYVDGYVLLTMLGAVIPVVLVVLGVSVEEFPGLARRAGAQAVGGRGPDPVADDLLLGDLLEEEGRLGVRVIAVRDGRRRVSRRRAPRR